MGIFADVIAGFPTETEKDFQATVDFIKEMKLAGLHVFSYSPRPYTKAAQWKQVPVEEIKRRAEILRNLDKELRRDFALSLVGTEQEVFVEERKTPHVQGISSSFQTVVIEGADSALRGLVKVLITRAEGSLCFGKQIS